MTFTVKLLRHDADKSANVRLPFVPVRGMYLMAPFANNDYRKVDEVYWNHTASLFEVYFEKSSEDA